jgi:hypothetical protein
LNRIPEVAVDDVACVVVVVVVTIALGLEEIGLGVVAVVDLTMIIIGILSLLVSSIVRLVETFIGDPR